MPKERWGSRLGIILAVAGSAIGLGNFLRFPGLAATNGGGAFLIPYFVSLLLLGLPLMWVEWTIGRFGGGFGHSTAPGMFHTMWNKNRFIKYFGVIGIFGPVVIFVYYTYIESWILGYSFFSLTGQYLNTDAKSIGTFLNEYRGLGDTHQFFPGIGTAYGFFLVTFFLNILVVWFGIRKGIQRVCEWGVPILFLFAVILLVRVFTLHDTSTAPLEGTVSQGLGFLWNPDWSKLWNGEAWNRVVTEEIGWSTVTNFAAAVNAKVWLAAAGQIFFTLSVGIGVILTYASYLSKKNDVTLSGLTAAGANEFAEVILGGSIVIPAAVVLLGATAVSSYTGSIFDLGFKAMPLAIQKIAMPQLFGFLWFGLLFIAGITSSISLAQPAIAFLEDEFNLTKRKAVVLFGVVTFLLCNKIIFGLGHGALDEFDFWGSTFCLPLFATIEIILFAWIFGMDKAWAEIHTGSDIRIPRVYRFIMKYVTPLLLLIILVAGFIDSGLPLLRMKGIDKESIPTVIASRLDLLFLFALITILVHEAWRRRKAEGTDQVGIPESIEGQQK